MKEILAVGGARFLIPTVLFVLVLYAIRGLFGLYGRRSQHRKEFLELWDSSRSQDDLWLEVAIRHLFGSYLPARVIRLAMAQPNRSQALFELSELWPLFRFDPDSETVGWLHKRHQTLRKRKAGRAVLFAGYFVCAGIAVVSALVAFRSGSNTFTVWVYGICALVFAFVAVVCLMREDNINTAATVGEYWVARINRSATQSQNVATGNEPGRSADLAARFPYEHATATRVENVL